MDNGYRRALSLISTVIFFTACGEPPKPYSELWKPAPIQVAAPLQAPLELCPNDGLTPPEDAKKAGYVEYAVSVTDASGKPFTGLSKSEFVVRRGDAELSIEYFREGAHPPVSIVIVFDSSFSMARKLGKNGATKLEFAREALLRLTGRLDSCDELALIELGGAPLPKEMSHNLALHPEERLGALLYVVNDVVVEPGPFGPVPYPTDPDLRTIRLLQSFTTSHALISSHANDLQALGGTPLYDSIHDGLKMLPNADYSSTALIAVTDGMDNGSAMSLSKIVAEAEHRRCPIYSLGIGDAEERETNLDFGAEVIPGHTTDWADAAGLQKLSDETGGKAFVVSPGSGNALAARDAAIDRIVNDLDSEYVIGVIAGDAENVRIALPSHPGAIVEMRSISPTPTSPTPSQR